VYFGTKRRGRGHQRIARQRARDQGRLREAPAVEQSRQRQRGRHLGTVDHTQPFLGAELQRFQAGGLERIGGGHALPPESSMAFADHDRGQVRERRQITRGADRTLTGDDRNQVESQQVLEALDQLPAHPGSAASQRYHFQNDDETNHGGCELLADTAAMGQDQIALQLRGLIGRDAGAGKLTEAGVDAVNRSFSSGRVGDDGGRSIDARLTGGIDA